MSSRQPPVPQNFNSELHLTQPQLMQQQQPSAVGEYYQKSIEMPEKNYHLQNVANVAENYSNKESYNFVASPNLLQHPENMREFKQNYNRELIGLRGNDISVMQANMHQQHQLATGMIYNKREHFMQQPSAPATSMQNPANYHRDNFNITENPNLQNRDNFNIRANCTNNIDSFGNAQPRRDPTEAMLRSQYNNNFVMRENEPLLQAAPVAKVFCVLNV